MPHILIRPYRPEDREGVVTLHSELQAFEHGFQPERAVGRAVSEGQVDEYLRMLSDETEDAHLLVAGRGPELAGFVFFLVESDSHHTEPEQVYVQDFIITKACRGRGLGTRFLEAVKDIMRAKGIHRIDLQVLVGNVDARAFYEKLGFETAYLGLNLWLDEENSQRDGQLP